VRAGASARGTAVSTRSAPSSVCWPQRGHGMRAPAASAGNSRCTPQLSHEHFAVRESLMEVRKKQKFRGKASRQPLIDNPRRIVKAPPPMKITYYLEVTSSWCYWAEPAWAELKQRFVGRVEFDWKIALMPSETFPVSRSQCEWFYRRSGTIMRSPFM